MAPIEARTADSLGEAKLSVSVIVVSYNTRDQLTRCLALIEPHHEIIVVDNGSSDGSAEMVRSSFPNAKLIENKLNLGFGAANNMGLKHATRDLVLFLNSDCYPSPGAIDMLAEAMENEEVCAVGGRLLNPDGSLQHSAARMLNLWHVFSEQSGLEKLWPSYWSTPSKSIREPVRVGQVMGACLMVRREAARFDEDFFLYCEDTDLVRRLVEQGRRNGREAKVLYIPRAEFVHELGASSKGDSRWLSIARYNRGKELYFLKHFGKLPAVMCWSLNRFGALLRLVLWTLVSAGTLFLWPGASGRTRLWLRVLTAPLSGPPRPVHTGS